MNTNNRFLKILVVLIFLKLAIPFDSEGQRITYSEQEKDDNRRTNFEIIGRVGKNYLIFKNNRNDNVISVYDYDMKLVNRVKQADLGDRLIEADFIAYPEFAWVIYQIQRKSIVYCMAVKIDGQGKRITEPMELDTTRIGWSANNKIYTTLVSDDKSKVMIFKVNNKDPENLIFTTLLFNNSLELQFKHRMNLAMQEKNENFTDFFIDNEGDMVFGKFIRKSSSEAISDVYMVIKKSNEEAFKLFHGKPSSYVLSEIRLKVDNNNKRYLFTALYFSQRRGNVEGLYTVVWDKSQDSIIRRTELPFDENMRKLGKGPDANLKTAFNEYYITNIITRKNGGYLLISEAMYTSTRGNNFNRWDYQSWNNPYGSSFDNYYWSPYSSNYYSPWSSTYNRYGYPSQSTRFHSENIMIFSFTKDGSLEWYNGIPKTQYDDNSDGLISHQVLIAGGALQVLFNLYERKTLLLNNQSISPDGQITRHPTLKNLDREIEFMPRFGKQVSSSALIVPCMYRNSLTFAKIEF